MAEFPSSSVLALCLGEDDSPLVPRYRKCQHCVLVDTFPAYIISLIKFFIDKLKFTEIRTYLIYCIACSNQEKGRQKKGCPPHRDHFSCLINYYQYQSYTIYIYINFNCLNNNYRNFKIRTYQPHLLGIHF